MRVGLVLLTPHVMDGRRRAMEHTATGLRQLDVGCDLITDPRVSYSVYDGLILSDTCLHSAPAVAAKLGAAPWVASHHHDAVTEQVLDNLARIRFAPGWAGVNVCFWPSIAEKFPHMPWELSTLPYALDDRLANLPAERPHDFLFAGRIEPRKGVLAFIAELHDLAEGGWQGSARIAGQSLLYPGGAYSYVLGESLATRGWSVMCESLAKTTNWVASHRDGGTIHYTGAYDNPRDVFGSARCYVNSTGEYYGAQHLEYTSMEALNAGCHVVALDDWPNYQYGATRPHVFADISDALRAPAASRDWNVRVLREKHDPRIAARAFLRALKAKVLQ